MQSRPLKQTSERVSLDLEVQGIRKVTKKEGNVSTQLYTYSMVRTLFDKGDDYIDSFWPFVLKVLPEDGSSLELKAIQDGIEKRFGLDIPQYSLAIIMTRAKRKNFVRQSGKKCTLTPNGLKYLLTFETERDVDRRTNELIEDARHFLNERHTLNFTMDETRSLIQSFIMEHLEFFEQFINPDREVPELCADEIKTLRIHEAALLDFFADVEQRKPAAFKTLQDIVCGSIISAMIQSKSLAEVVKKFQRTTIYLDTNFAFSILGISFDEFNIPAQELFKLMQSENAFEFKVFDFTVDEMVGVLRAYSKEQAYYVPSIRVNSIFSNLKTKGWTPAAVKELIVGIEERLWTLGIKIEPTNIDLQRYMPMSGEYKIALEKYKPGQGPREQNHDLAAIDKIAELRKGSVRLIESAKALFLTSDLRLAKYDFCERGHREKETLCEVIPDRLLTNILWLKHPSLIKELPLKSIISMHSRHLFIDREVWGRFRKTVLDLRRKGDIEGKDISILLYDKHIQEILRTYNHEDARKIEANWLLKNIANAKDRIDKIKDQELEKFKMDFEQKLVHAEKEKEEKLLRKIEEIKKSIETKSEEKAKYLIIGLGIVATIILVVISILTIPSLLNKWQVIEPLAWLVTLLIPIILVVLGIRVDVGKTKVRLKGWFFNRIYRKALRNSRIGELEAELES